MRSVAWGANGRGADAGAMSEQRRLTPPRYRVERRVPGEAGFIVGFADTAAVSRSILLRGAARLAREGAAGEVVVVDQETEAIAARRTVPGRG